MPNKRKYISTEYGMVNLRDGDRIVHLDPEALAELYWEVQDEKLVRVVRCQDCKMHTNEEPGMVFCPSIVGSWMEADGYCSLGVKKDE